MFWSRSHDKTAWCVSSHMFGISGMKCPLTQMYQRSDKVRNMKSVFTLTTSLWNITSFKSDKLAETGWNPEDHPSGPRKVYHLGSDLTDVSYLLWFSSGWVWWGRWRGSWCFCCSFMSLFLSWWNSSPPFRPNSSSWTLVSFSNRSRISWFRQ